MLAPETNTNSCGGLDPGFVLFALVARVVIVSHLIVEWNVKTLLEVQQSGRSFFMRGLL